MRHAVSPRFSHRPLTLSRKLRIETACVCEWQLVFACEWKLVLESMGERRSA